MSEVTLKVEELAELISAQVDKAIKDNGLDKIDRKLGVFPDTTEDDLKTMTKGERFKKWVKAVMRRDYTVKELVEGSGSGSYTVPSEWAAEINRVANDTGIARKLCQQVSPSGATLYVPNETASVTIYLPGETTAYTESSPTLEQKTLTIKAAGGISTLSNELLADANVDLLAYFAEIFGEGLADFEDTHTFGSSTSYFEPLLALSSAQTVTMATSSYTDIHSDDLMKMLRAVAPKYWKNAAFFMHPYVFSYVQQLKDTQGRYIVQNPTDITQPAMIWGRPVHLVNTMPSSDASATAFIGLANPKQCWFGLRGGMEIKISEQATLTTAGNLWEQNLSAMRVIERFGQVWLNEAGTCYLKTA